MKAKPFTITKRELRSALAKLGRSADAVARTLRTRRIKGYDTGTDCPVAMFLRRYFRIHPELVANETDAKIEKGRIAVSVGCKYVMINGAKVKPTPRPVKDFIKTYDGEDYADDNRRAMLYGSLHA